MKKIICVIAGSLLAVGVVSGSMYCGYRYASGGGRVETVSEGNAVAENADTNKAAEHGKNSKMQQTIADVTFAAETEEDEKTTKAADISTTAEEKPKDAKLAAIEELVQATDTNDWASMKNLCTNITDYLSGNIGSRDSHSEKYLTIEGTYFPEVPGIAELPQTPDWREKKTRGERKRAYMDWFRNNDCNYIYHHAAPGSPIQFNLNGMDLYLGEAKISDFKMLFEQNNLYVGTAQYKGLHNTKPRKMSNEKYGVDQCFLYETQGGGFVPDDTIRFEILPMTGEIIGIQVTINDPEVDGIVWHLDNDKYKNMTREDVIKQYGEADVKDDGREMYDRDTTIIFDYLPDGSINTVTYLLSSNRIMNVEK